MGTLTVRLRATASASSWPATKMIPSTSWRSRCSTESSRISRVSRDRLTELAKSPASRAASSMVRWMLSGPKCALAVLITPMIPVRPLTRARAAEFGR